MITQLAPFFYQQFFDLNGVPLAGGLIWTYQAGTTTPQATYTDSTGATPNTNPIVLDASGRCNIWLGTLSYKFVVMTSASVTLWTQDNVAYINPGSIISSMIANGAVGTAQLANLAVTQPKLALQSVGGNATAGQGQIIDASITNVQVAPGTLLGSNIADNTIDTTELTNNVLGIIAASAYLNWETIQNSIELGNHGPVGLAFGNNTFVAVCTDGSVLTSSDFGRSWTPVATGFGTIWQSVAFGGGKFVAVGQNAAGSQVMYSTNNGAAWTAVSIAGNPAYMGSICFGGGLFVATQSKNVGPALAFFSPDGIAWTAGTLPAIGGLLGLGTVAFGTQSGNAYISPILGTDSIMRSTDGMTWVSIVVGSTYPVGATAVAYGNGVWILNSLVSSLDNGLTWADMPTAMHYPLSAGNNPFNQTLYGNGCFVIMSPANSVMMFTKDLGATWVQNSGPSTVLLSTTASPGGVNSEAGYLNGVGAFAYGQGIFVALGNGTNSTRSGMAIQTVA